MYEEAKISLLKFKGDTTHQSSIFNFEVGVKPTTSEKCEEAFVVDGYDKQGKNEVIVNSSTNIGNHKQVQLYGSGDVLKRKRRNPLGSNGRPLLCRSCGSYRHLVAKCPDSWENVSKLRVHKSDNNIDQQLVLLT